MAKLETQLEREKRRTAPGGKSKAEVRSRRKIALTVSSWIFESRKKTRVEEIAAIREVFGKDILLS
jgi:hypothetical protein